MFFLSIILVAVITACLPYIVRYIPHFFPKTKLYDASPWIPIVAAIFIVGSTFLPNIHISNETSTFQQHFVGGGMYSASLYIYAKQLFGWRLQWLLDIIVLFAWVSAFGVANKLLEFTLLKLHLAVIDTADADWDLLANTLGGFFGYVLLYKFSRPKKRSQIK